MEASHTPLFPPGASKDVAEKTIMEAFRCPHTTAIPLFLSLSLVPLSTTPDDPILCRKHLSIAEQDMAKEAKKNEAKKKKQDEEKAAKAAAAPAVIEDPNKDGMIIEEVVEDAEVK